MPAPINTPGITPPRNSAAIEVPVRAPHTISWMLGGMIVPMTELDAVTATEKSSL